LQCQPATVRYIVLTLVDLICHGMDTIQSSSYWPSDMPLYLFQKKPIIVRCFIFTLSNFIHPRHEHHELNKSCQIFRSLPSIMEWISVISHNHSLSRDLFFTFADLYDHWTDMSKVTGPFSITYFFLSIHSRSLQSWNNMNNLIRPFNATYFFITLLDPISVSLNEKEWPAPPPPAR
jgi:hypothetical protein